MTRFEIKKDSTMSNFTTDAVISTLEFAIGLIVGGFVGSLSTYLAFRGASIEVCSVAGLVLGSDDVFLLWSSH